MRVGVDARHLTGGRGVARYARSLLCALGEAFPGDDWRGFVPGRAPVAPVHDSVELVRHPLGGRALFGAAAVVGRPALDGLLGGVDVIWAPAPAPLAISRDVPLVLTVHDLSWERRPQDFSPYERAWHRLARPRALGARAHTVVTDSAAVRDEVLEAWALEPARVRIVTPGLGLEAREGAEPEPHPVAPARYLLFVGALEPRKGPDVLARAFALARARGLDAELVVVGEGRLAGTLSGPGIHRAGAVSDAELDALYSGALALVQPSWLEGFGMPPLEAAARGTPAIVSDLAVFAETLGADGALRITPGDAHGLADAMLRVTRDDALRERLAIAAGRAASRLEWTRAARELREVLAEAAG
jgi:glycosyltransferase involved in cell wall biosynthesis